LSSGINKFLNHQQFEPFRPDFIRRPLRDILNNGKLSLPELLPYLHVLELRYQDEYQGIDPVDWHSDFPTTIELYSDLNNKQPSKLTHELTLKDQGHFRNISAQNVMVQDDIIKSINTTWWRRFQEVQALALISSDYMEDLVKVSLV
jgi:hypothetical protein